MTWTTSAGIFPTRRSARVVPGQSPPTEEDRPSTRASSSPSANRRGSGEPRNHQRRPHHHQRPAGDEQMNFGCYLNCIRVLPPSQFVGARDLPGRLPVNMRRFCIPCGVGASIHHPGDSVVATDGRRVWAEPVVNAVAGLFDAYGDAQLV
ncbi:hypothetical protein DL769_003201 [Monosporascus sp. CRB-8-3]|nr:hypothetical protein DL769_003201 [Monosporascus sp. CRB-8-3]